MTTDVYPADSLRAYKYVVVFARTVDGLILCRKRGRETWETPGGHIEPGETPLAAAKRELWEETGAEASTIEKAFDYHSADDMSEASGQVFYATVESAYEPPATFEMAEAHAFRALPDALTYPGILPVLLRAIETRFGRVVSAPNTDREYQDGEDTKYAQDRDDQ